MSALAALMQRQSSVRALRRAIPRSQGPLYIARSERHLHTLLYRHALDAVLLDADAARGAVFDALRREFAALPLIVYAPLRSDDAALLGHLHREGRAALLIEGLDEPAAPRIVARHGLITRRLDELRALAARLELTDPLQQRVWTEIIIHAADRRHLTAQALAARMGLRRETVSRAFGAGGAPTLKRAIDAVRLIAAAQLLGNAGYRVRDVAQLLGYSSVASLGTIARRVFGVSPRQLTAIDGDRVVAALVDPGRWA